MSITTKQQRDISNSDLFIKEFDTAVNASCGVIYVKSREWVRTLRAIMPWCYESGTNLRVWSNITGWMTYPTMDEWQAAIKSNRIISLDFDRPKAVDQSAMDVIKALQQVYLQGRSPIVPVQGAANSTPLHLQDNCGDLHTCNVILFPSKDTLNLPIVQQYIRQQVRDAEVATKTLVIVEHPATPMPKALESDFEIIEHKDPSHIELLAEWDTLIQGLSENTYAHFSAEDIDTIVQNAIGMTCVEFAKTVAMASVELTEQLRAAKKVEKPKESLQLTVEDYRKVTHHDFIKYVTRSKMDVLKRTNLLELTPSVPIENIGGLDILKTWLSERKAAFSDEARSFGIDAPKGFLVVGAPGTGKSLVAKATSSVLNIPCIRLDVGKVYGKYVGDSESGMRESLARAEASAPCVLFLDEIDKGFAGSGGDSDSGASSRVLGTFLTWMQERKPEDNPVFVVMTANRVSGLPPELLRKGRLDEIFSVTFPNEIERKAIVQIHFENRGHRMSEDFYTQAAKATERMVGAEIESVVKETLLACFLRKSDVTIDVFIEHTKIPLQADTFAQVITDMDEWAKNNAKAASSAYNNDIAAGNVTVRAINRGAGRNIRIKRKDVIN